MHIKIEFIGFPVIYDLFPAGDHDYTFPGSTLKQLIEDLIARNDSRVKESLINPGTEFLDPTIQVMINRRVVPRDKLLGETVAEGDQITFLKLLAGG